MVIELMHILKEFFVNGDELRDCVGAIALFIEEHDHYIFDYKEFYIGSFFFLNKKDKRWKCLMNDPVSGSYVRMHSGITYVFLYGQRNGI